ncbi:MAG: thioesterase family protein [Pseudomonadota bacterium]
MTSAPFIYPQKVLFKHCDPAGIVFYPRYFEMINDCVEAYFDQIGFPFEELHKSGGVPTAQIETKFTAPSRHGDHLNLSLELTHVGGASLNIAVKAVSGEEIRFAAALTIVHVNASGRSASWPAPMRHAFIPNLRSIQ